MSEIKHITKLSPSPDICSSCTRLLLSDLKDPVLLHHSVVSLHRSAQSCSLCLLIWRSLMGLLTVKNGPRSHCSLDDLVANKPGQPSEIWGRRHMVDFASLGMNLRETTQYGWDIPISFIEVMMAKTDLVGHLERELRLARAPESTKLKNAWWGLKCDPDAIREAGACPFLWEYSQEVRDTWRRIKGESHIQAKGPSTFFQTVADSTRPRDVWWAKGECTEAKYVACLPTHLYISPYSSMTAQVLFCRDINFAGRRPRAIPSCSHRSLPAGQ